VPKQHTARRPGRRNVLAGFAALPSFGLSAAAAADPANEIDLAGQWKIFRDRFMTLDGRIIDTGNGGISHSEGQGWGMLFATAAGDQVSFDLIHAWTTTHLSRPDDALHVWRYDPAAANPTADQNNATDGDIFIAWALAKAAQRWTRPALADAAASIALDVLAKLCVPVGDRLVLLPALTGFTSPGAVTLNPSYYIFPAFDVLAALAPSPHWDRLRSDGIALIGEGVFGTWSLPPDWLAVDRASLALSPAPQWPPRFGYDAIRVPLWLSWAGLMPAALGAAFAAYWTQDAQPFHPAWVDLKTGETAKYAASSGMAAVQMVAMGAAPDLPDVTMANDYYSASLTLLCLIAEVAKTGS